ncbi:hypothetical protein Deipr_0123 [Deinococcus proteolyticus MRP]|uniref:Prepilin-type N-terminal cleavage/methylation domain-containing protein n=1 Tax=Deinococcus proteolyticus (strain ATCC 35074 / DSM 20540 / JCM 6276 / NBRC 101906 / NCIMB 13154 / VKM Ac-1939 / CCM 2703 / MRP) TaxID=693977 RepID=F0RNR5_DEIPM|nr:type II secretion system protein [Deinococcus proteolyticus]ADY25298.1 hypothetical protein Deipr_0123 [Deinococcus proteolyticus MRP]
MNTKRAQGLTLVELLVGMGILALLLVAVSSFFTSTSDGAVQVNTRAELQQDVLNVEQLLASRIKEAWYIYTPNRGQINLGTGQLRQNPLSGTGVWNLDTVTGTVDGGHMLAMILPPENAALNCTADTKGCFRFYAYYPVKRSVWVAGTASDGANNPGAGPNDANTWVLVELRANYLTGLSAVLPPQPLPGESRPLASTKPGAANFNYVPAISLPAAAPPNTGSANLLADNIAPMTASEPMFTFIQEPVANNVHSAVSTQEIVLRIAAVQQAKGRVIRLPAANSFYELRSFPGNLGRR